MALFCSFCVSHGSTEFIRNINNVQLLQRTCFTIGKRLDNAYSFFKAVYGVLLPHVLSEYICQDACLAVASTMGVILLQERVAHRLER